MGVIPWFHHVKRPWPTWPAAAPGTGASWLTNSDHQPLQRLPVDGARVRYADRGNAQAILLIDGGWFGSWPG